MKDEELKLCLSNDNTLVLKKLLKEKEMEVYLINGYALYECVQQKAKNCLKLLLNEIKVIPSMVDNYVVLEVIKNNDIDLLKIFLMDSKVEPAKSDNLLIKEAKILNNEVAINLLWEQESVKVTLKKDDLNLYTYLKRKDVNKKLKKF